MGKQCGLFTKAVPVHTSGALFTKAVPVHKTGRRFTKAVHVHKTGRRFTKAMPGHKTRTALRKQCLSTEHAPLTKAMSVPKHKHLFPKLPLTPLVPGNNLAFTFAVIRLQQSGSINNFLFTQFVSLTVNPPPHNFFNSKRSSY